MSTYNILAVCDGDGAGEGLYPVPGEQANTVEAEQRDGAPSALLTVGELLVHEIAPGGSSKRLLRVHDVKAAVSVTDARVTIACSKYQKGGGWTPWTLGAVPVALAANAVSKVRAARRRRGKMLVGHVRYPWLLSVGFKERSTPIGHDRLRLGTLDPTQQSFRGLLLDLTLPRQQTGRDLARQIAISAASYRLRHASGELDDATRQRLDRLIDPEPLVAQPKQFSSYLFVDAAQQGLPVAALQTT